MASACRAASPSSTPSQNIPRFDTAGKIIGQDTSEFFGVSDTSYNVTLAYDHVGRRRPPVIRVA